VKIRHYGLYASGNVNTRLEAARRLLSNGQPPDEYDQAEFLRLLEELAPAAPEVCPACGIGRMIDIPVARSWWPTPYRPRSAVPEPDT
jgi:hypothetical protein